MNLIKSDNKNAVEVVYYSTAFFSRIIPMYTINVKANAIVTIGCWGILGKFANRCAIILTNQMNGKRAESINSDR